MIDLDKLEQLIKGKTPGDFEVVKLPYFGGWAVYARGEPMENRFDLLEDISEGDAKFFAGMGSCTEELFAVIKATFTLLDKGIEAEDCPLIDLGKALDALKAKLKEIF